MSDEVFTEEMKDWGAYWQIYDTVNIGPSIDPKVDGWFANFTDMANAVEVPFLNVRNVSQAGKSYTNIETGETIPWWFDLNSIGFRWRFPDPAINVGSEHLGITTMSKQFVTELPEHCWVDFDIRSYTFLRLKGSHLPAGFGPEGHFEMGVGTNTGFTSLINNSQTQMTNRWKFLKNIRLPRNTPIKATINFDEHAKDMLREWADVPGIDYGGETPFPNLAQIEITLRGIRYEQRIGEFRK